MVMMIAVKKKATTKAKPVARKRRVKFDTVLLRDKDQAERYELWEDEIKIFAWTVAKSEQAIRESVEWMLQMRKLAKKLRRNKVMPLAMVADVNAAVNDTLTAKQAVVRLQRAETKFEGTGFSRAKRQVAKR